MGWMNPGFVDFDQHLVTNNRDRPGEMTRDIVDALMVPMQRV